MARQPTRQEIDRAAAGWLVRLGNPALDDGDRRAFRAGVDADPAHAASFDEARRLWDGLAAPAAALAAAERRRVGWQRLGAAAAACVLLAVAGLLLRDPADYATGYGTMQAVTLADGSRMTLDGNAAADVRLDAGERRVTLRRGRGFFEVAPEPSRPFVVVAGPVETEVLGTAFAVDRRGEAVEITVEHGRVSVRGNGAAVDLAPGERATATADRVDPPEAAVLATALAWRRGLMVFEDRPLAEVAADLGRATGARIVIPQPSVRGLRLSGVFRVDDPAAVFAAIEAGLDVRVAPVGVATVIFR